MPQQKKKTAESIKSMRTDAMRKKQVALREKSSKPDDDVMNSGIETDNSKSEFTPRQLRPRRKEIKEHTNTSAESKKNSEKHLTDASSSVDSETDNCALLPENNTENLFQKSSPPSTAKTSQLTNQNLLLPNLTVKEETDTPSINNDSALDPEMCLSEELAIVKVYHELQRLRPDLPSNEAARLTAEKFSITTHAMDCILHNFGQAEVTKESGDQDLLVPIAQRTRSRQHSTEETLPRTDRTVTLSKKLDVMKTYHKMEQQWPKNKVLWYTAQKENLSIDEVNRILLDYKNGEIGPESKEVVKKKNRKRVVKGKSRKRKRNSSQKAKATSKSQNRTSIKTQLTNKHLTECSTLNSEKTLSLSDLETWEELDVNNGGSNIDPKFWSPYCTSCKLYRLGSYICLQCPQSSRVICRKCEFQGSHSQHYLLRVPLRPLREVQEIIDKLSQLLFETLRQTNSLKIKQEMLERDPLARASDVLPSPDSMTIGRVDGCTGNLSLTEDLVQFSNEPYAHQNRRRTLSNDTTDSHPSYPKRFRHESTDFYSETDKPFTTMTRCEQSGDINTFVNEISVKPFASMTNCEEKGEMNTFGNKIPLKPFTSAATCEEKGEMNTFGNKIPLKAFTSIARCEQKGEIPFGKVISFQPHAFLTNCEQKREMNTFRYGISVKPFDSMTRYVYNGELNKKKKTLGRYFNYGANTNEYIKTLEKPRIVRSKRTAPADYDQSHPKTVTVGPKQRLPPEIQDHTYTRLPAGVVEDQTDHVADRRLHSNVVGDHTYTRLHANVGDGMTSRNTQGNNAAVVKEKDLMNIEYCVKQSEQERHKWTSTSQPIPVRITSEANVFQNKYNGIELQAVERESEKPHTITHGTDAPIQTPPEPSKPDCEPLKQECLVYFEMEHHAMAELGSQSCDETASEVCNINQSEKHLTEDSNTKRLKEMKETEVNTNLSEGVLETDICNTNRTEHLLETEVFNTNRTGHVLETEVFNASQSEGVLETEGCNTDQSEAVLDTEVKLNRSNEVLEIETGVCNINQLEDVLERAFCDPNRSEEVFETEVNNTNQAEKVNETEVLNNNQPEILQETVNIKINQTENIPETKVSNTDQPESKLEMETDDQYQINKIKDGNTNQSKNVRDVEDSNITVQDIQVNVVKMEPKDLHETNNSITNEIEVVTETEVGNTNQPEHDLIDNSVKMETDDNCKIDNSNTKAEDGNTNEQDFQLNIVNMKYETNNNKTNQADTPENSNTNRHKEENDNTNEKDIKVNIVKLEPNVFHDTDNSKTKQAGAPETKISNTDQPKDIQTDSVMKMETDDQHKIYNSNTNLQEANDGNTNYLVGIEIDSLLKIKPDVLLETNSRNTNEPEDMHKTDDGIQSTNHQVDIEIDGIMKMATDDQHEIPSSPSGDPILDHGHTTNECDDHLARELSKIGSEDSATDSVEQVQLPTLTKACMHPADLPETMDPGYRTGLLTLDAAADHTSVKLLSQTVFKWTSDPTIHKQYRQPFKSTSGPTLATDGRPLDIFHLIWSDLIDNITTETNKCAARYIQNRLNENPYFKSWIPVTSNEIMVFLALTILKASLSVPERVFFLSKAFASDARFKNIMCYSRYICIKAFLSFSDEQDGMEKLKSVAEHLNGQFSALYAPAQLLSFDESWLTKPHRPGFIEKAAIKTDDNQITMFELTDLATGYLWAFDIGKTSAGRDETTPRLVELLQPLLHKGHTLVLDSFYTSPLLARYLKANDTDCFGTLRLKRDCVPFSLEILKETLPAGSAATSICEDQSITLWRPSQLVALLSTYHPIDQQYNITKPQVAVDYDNTMTDIYIRDQILAKFNMERKGLPWHKNLFFRLLKASILNSYVLYNYERPDKVTRYKFRRELVDDILRAFWVSPSVPSTVCRPLEVAREARKLVAQGTSELRSSEVHLICPRTMEATCEVCQRQTKFNCSTCRVPLCISKCFQNYHMK